VANYISVLFKQLVSEHAVVTSGVFGMHSTYVNAIYGTADLWNISDRCTISQSYLAGGAPPWFLGPT